MSGDKVGTEFTNASQTTKLNHPEGRPGLPLLTPAGEKLIARTAPRNPYVTNVAQSDVDKNGGK